MGFRTLPDGRVIFIENAKPTASVPSRPALTKPKQYDGFKSHSAFTIPNYTCRTCGQRVFYYEHPNGAKVLFDQLGPPWPKHPCYEATSESTAKKQVTQPKSKKSLWLPMLCKQAVRLNSGGLRTQVTFEGGNLRFELSAAQVKQLAINEQTISDTLILGLVNIQNKQAEVSVHSGLTQERVFASSLKIHAPQQTNSSVTNSVREHETAQTITVSDNPKVLIKPAVEKQRTEPTVKVVNRRIHLQRITLAMKSEQYYVVNGFTGDKQFELGLSLKIPSNLNVLKYLATNPKTLVLSPGRSGSDSFKVVIKGKKMGRLESKLQQDSAREMPPSDLKESTLDNPFRNPVLTNSLSEELKALFAKNI